VAGANRFEDLLSWQRMHELNIEVWKATEHDPWLEISSVVACHGLASARRPSFTLANTLKMNGS
jgi:hypothetical protein